MIRHIIEVDENIQIHMDEDEQVLSFYDICDNKLILEITIEDIEQAIKTLKSIK